MSEILKDVVAAATKDVSISDTPRSRRYRDPKKRGAKGYRALISADVDTVSNPDSRPSATHLDRHRIEIAKIIATKVRQQRKWRFPFHTQDDMAQVLGTSRATIVAIERGTRKLTAVELVLLADWWQIDVRELLPSPGDRIAR